MSTRFACRCGRFLADSAITYTTFRDDSRYYGIRDEVEWDCSRCGHVKGKEWEPQIVCTRPSYCPCVELCEMGPTCPAASPDLPGAGCWRATTPPTTEGNRDE